VESCFNEIEDIPLSDIAFGTVSISDEGDDRGDLIVIEGGRPMGRFRLRVSF
jgi:hypothetical protein